MTTQLVKVNLSQNKKAKPEGELGFGKYFSDHMMICDFERASGWLPPQVVPYGDFSVDPGAAVLHYGQALFEGMKAFSQTNGQIVLFRPEYNYNRMCEGAARLCMEMPSYEVFLAGLVSLVDADKDWVPKQRGSSLYLRPTLIGTEAFLGVRPSDRYRFFIIASPVSSYYKEGIGPVKIWVEENYVRAAQGGLGATKAAANYAGSLKAAQDAKKMGYSQVLWLDVTHQYIEEVGTMNVFFIINGEAHTPALDGTILSGGVRDCAIQLLNSMGIKVNQRKVTWQEVLNSHLSGELTEAFGTGTAAVISPIGELNRAGTVINLAKANDSFKVARELYNKMTAIQYGEAEDIFNWLHRIK